jgi:hypothetical protein
VRGVLFIALILQGVFAFCQSISEQDLIGKHFFVEGFQSRLPLSFTKWDAVVLKEGVEFEAFFFAKHGKLKVVESYEWCGNTTLFERLYNCIFGSLGYRNYVKGQFQVYPNILCLKFNGEEYYCKILKVKRENGEIKSICLTIQQKNPKQRLLRG